MKEGVLDVELVDGPALPGGETENRADGRGLDDGAESLVVVDSSTLSEATQYPSCLVASKSTIGGEFVLEDPLS